jgi:hypothetical protein
VSSDYHANLSQQATFAVSPQGRILADGLYGCSHCVYIIFSVNGQIAMYEFLWLTFWHHALPMFFWTYAATVFSGS